MQKDLHTIVRVFPDFEEKIEFLFLSDENFRDLCSDYMLCAKSVQDIKEDLMRYKEQMKEYEGVKKNLELEILRMIVKSQ